MALSKGFRVLHKAESQTNSIILEARHREDCLLFESGVIAVLSEQTSCFTLFTSKLFIDANIFKCLVLFCTLFFHGKP